MATHRNNPLRLALIGDSSDVFNGDRLGLLQPFASMASQKPYDDGDLLLLVTGDFFLLESGDKMILE